MGTFEKAGVGKHEKALPGLLGIEARANACTT